MSGIIEFILIKYESV